MLPVQIEHPVTKQLHLFWFENPVVGRPIKEDAPPGADTRLFPRDCREGVSSQLNAFVYRIRPASTCSQLKWKRRVQGTSSAPWLDVVAVIKHDHFAYVSCMTMP